jgi:DNA primase
VSHDWSFDAKDLVRRATDIVDLVGHYVQLRRNGRNYVGLCPWHDDTRPSLQVNPDRQSFKCWVCDIGGDAFSFVMRMENLAFPEALQMLAERAGIPLEQRGLGNAGGQSDLKPLLYRAMAWAADQYHRHLVAGAGACAARDYLTARGISDESIARFQLGFAPDSWNWLLERSAGTEFSPRILESAGLVMRRQAGAGYYDRFRGRVLFTICDPQGRPVALGGRALPGAPKDLAKYINSPETPLFSKSSLLYGLDLAREACHRTRQVIVVEGYTDVIVAHQHGFKNVVAVLGTALGERHVRLLRRYAEEVVLLLDGDDAGRRRTNEVLELFVANQVNLRVTTLPDDLDPCDFLQQRGAAAFAQSLEQAVDALEHRLRTLTTPGVRLGMHAANEAIEDILNTLAKAPRLTAQTASAARLREEQVIQRLARVFEIPEEVVRGRLAALRARPRQHAAPFAGRGAKSPGAHVILDSWERELLEVLLQDLSLVERVFQVIGAEHFLSEVCRQIMLVCRDLSENEGEVEFTTLLTRFDQPEIKSLLVDLDERGREKHVGSIPERLEQLLERFRRRGEEARRRQELSALRERRLNEEEGVKLLLEAIQQGRDRHCISKSTDG